MSDLVINKRCGLYKTGASIVLGGKELPAPALVYFHNHPDKNEKILMMPKSNTGNRWAFHEKGFRVDDDSFIVSLTQMKSEGLYRLKEHFHPNDSEWVPKNALVQLGYNGSADPILFFPYGIEKLNGIQFPDRGMKITEKIYALLEPMDLRGPQKNDGSHVH